MFVHEFRASLFNSLQLFFFIFVQILECAFRKYSSILHPVSHVSLGSPPALPPGALPSSHVTASTASSPSTISSSSATAPAPISSSVPSLTTAPSCPPLFASSSSHTSPSHPGSSTSSTTSAFAFSPPPACSSVPPSFHSSHGHSNSSSEIHGIPSLSSLSASASFASLPAVALGESDSSASVTPRLSLMVCIFPSFQCECLISFPSSFCFLFKIPATKRLYHCRNCGWKAQYCYACAHLLTSDEICSSCGKVTFFS